ncbi:MAG: LL-diaminopimelate aminotransferase [Gammaproteobacteria bacterium]|nr:LL-diaminopimelate aminotransferase [Gammaproteobacteria bacterium]
MVDSIRKNIADRMGGAEFGSDTKLYKFAKIKKAKAEAIQNNPGKMIIDMGVGEPDYAADPLVVETLKQEAGKLENRWYADNGIVDFQLAAARYMQKIYGINGLTEKNIIHGLGSKPILSMIPTCFINPGDITLMTIPGYPVLGTYTKYLGGDTYSLPLVKENDFYPDLNAIPADVLAKSKLLYINYPNNPTGRVATSEFFKQVIDFAHKHELVVVSDAAYAALAFNNKPLSIFSIDGAFDVALEIHSLSKAFNMTGWRLAFIVGSELLIKLYGTVKDNTDSGQFRAIQKAGITALEHPEITQKTLEKYGRRADLLVNALNGVGFSAEKPQGTFYCYVKSPRGTKHGVTFNSAEDASQYLIKEALVSTVPWDDAGAYLRFSLAFEAKDIDEEKRIIEETRSRLEKLGLIF